MIHCLSGQGRKTAYALMCARTARQAGQEESACQADSRLIGVSFAPHINGNSVGKVRLERRCARVDELCRRGCCDGVEEGFFSG